MIADRDILQRYVNDGKLMQVSTISAAGEPWLCHVWYSARFSPDRLYFISRQDRKHSTNIRNDGRVAGGIVTIPLTGLGQTVTGVTFRGLAAELDADAGSELEQFISRWPRARDSITTGRLVTDDTPSRLYEIRVDEWVLFDEENFAGSPRRVIPAEQ